MSHTLTINKIIQVIGLSLPNIKTSLLQFFFLCHGIISRTQAKGRSIIIAYLPLIQWDQLNNINGTEYLQSLLQQMA